MVQSESISNNSASSVDSWATILGAHISVAAFSLNSTFIECSLGRKSVALADVAFP